MYTNRVYWKGVEVYREYAKNRAIFVLRRHCADIFVLLLT